jgi:hypothetical protein
MKLWLSFPVLLAACFSLFSDAVSAAECFTYQSALRQGPVHCGIDSDQLHWVKARYPETLRALREGMLRFALARVDRMRAP